MVGLFASSWEIVLVLLGLDCGCSFFAVEVRIILLLDLDLNMRRLANYCKNFVFAQQGQNLFLMLLNVIFDRRT